MLLDIRTKPYSKLPVQVLTSSSHLQATLQQAN
jgi:hypothetical protein